MHTRPVPAFNALNVAILIRHHVLGVSLLPFIQQAQSCDRGAAPGQPIGEHRDVEIHQLIRLDEQVEIGPSLKVLALPAREALHTFRAPESVVEIAGSKAPHARQTTCIVGCLDALQRFATRITWCHLNHD